MPDPGASTPGSLRRFPGLFVLGALASLVLSAWCVWADPVINNDGVYYVRAASAIAEGDWHLALSIHPWPFYSASIAYLGKLTGIGPLGAAHALNAALAALLVVGFLCTVRELGGDRSTLVFALLLILLFPTLNKYRSFVIRDIGYLALHVWSICFLFRYWKSRAGGPLLGWLACAVAACLFRVEGIAILVMTPVLLFALREHRSPVYRWSLVAAVALAGSALAFLLGLWLIKDTALTGVAGRLTDPGALVGVIGELFTDTVGAKLQLLKEQFAGRYYLPVYVMIIVFVALAELLRRLAVVYAVVAVWGYRRRIAFPEAGLRPLWVAMIAVNTLILVGSAFFISIVVARYALAATVTVLLAAPFVYSHLWRRWGGLARGARERWALPGLLVLTFLLGVSGLDVFTEKDHLAEAGRWLRQNTPEGATLHSNNLIVIYYSGKDAYHDDDNYSWRHTYGVIKSRKWRDYDYVAIELSDEEYPWLEWLEIHLHGPPIKRINGEHGSSVFIYRNPLS